MIGYDHKKIKLITVSIAFSRLVNKRFNSIPKFSLSPDTIELPVKWLSGKLLKLLSNI